MGGANFTLRGSSTLFTQLSGHMETLSTATVADWALHNTKYFLQIVLYFSTFQHQIGTE
jgi:hypothetical protein